MKGNLKIQNHDINLRKRSSIRKSSSTLKRKQFENMQAELAKKRETITQKKRPKRSDADDTAEQSKQERSAPKPVHKDNNESNDRSALNTEVSTERTLDQSEKPSSIRPPFKKIVERSSFQGRFQPERTVPKARVDVDKQMKKKTTTKVRRNVNNGSEITFDSYGSDEPGSVEIPANNVNTNFSTKLSNVTIRNGGKVSLSIDKYNEMKAELDHMKLQSRQQYDTIRLWQEKCEQLRKDNEKLKINIQFNNLDKNNTSVSKTSNKDSTFEKKQSTNACKEKSFYDEIKRMNVPYEIANILRDLYKGMAYYAHQYTSEVCCSIAHDFPSTIDWSPNMYNGDDGVIRDWRGRSITITEFDEKRLKNKGCSHSSGAPLVTLGNESDENISVDSITFPICPMEEALKGNTYSTTEEAEKNFIGQSALLLLRSKSNDDVPSDLDRKVFDYASRSNEMHTRFQSSCRQAIGTRKNKAKELYFSCIGYGIVTSCPKRGISILAMKDFLCKKKNAVGEVYEKLNKHLDDGSRDTTYWRMASFNSICSTGTREEVLHQTNGVDNIFFNEPSRIAFRAFRKHELGPDQDATVNTLIRFDAIITSIIDSFPTLVTRIDDQINQIDAQSNNNDNHEENNSLTRSTDASQRNMNMVKTKGGTIPIESVNRYKQLLPISAAQFLNQALHLFKMSISESSTLLQNELMVSSTGSENTRLGNMQRKYTYAFKHPDNGRYYISLHSETFSTVICDWYGSVSDCFVLRTKKLDEPFKPFQEDDPYSVIHDSDSEDDSGKKDLAPPPEHRSAYGFGYDSEDEDEEIC